MSKLLMSLLCSLVLLTSSYAADTPLPTHLAQIEALQKRSDALVFGDVGANNYHLAKARAWLDLALSEYHQTDTSGMMYGAIVQAETLITALENKQADISMDTPNTLQGTEVVRTDLWEKIAIAKQNLNMTCGQRDLAEAEVELVWAGHEKMEAGWSHAESYGRSVEDSLYASEVSMDNCAKAIAKTAPSIEKSTLSGDALFEFGTNVLLPNAPASLDKLAESIKEWKSLQAVNLVGYTDRLRTDGNEAKNQELSDKRAERVKQYLAARGIPADKIFAAGAGSSKPVMTCPSDVSKAQQVICLQPNRRVEVTLRGEK
jgi:OmpA-OmpF porin, OOP family